jgi:hypothetical protein
VAAWAAGGEHVPAPLTDGPPGADGSHCGRCFNRVTGADNVGTTRLSHARESTSLLWCGADGVGSDFPTQCFTATDVVGTYRSRPWQPSPKANERDHPIRICVLSVKHPANCQCSKHQSNTSSRPSSMPDLEWDMAYGVAKPVSSRRTHAGAPSAVFAPLNRYCGRVAPTIALVTHADPSQPRRSRRCLQIPPRT